MFKSTKTAAWSDAASTGCVISGKCSKRSPFFPPQTPLRKSLTKSVTSTVWTQYQLAVHRGDSEQIRELELRCDGIAVLTLRRLGVNPERLVRAVEMLTWYNEQRHWAANRKEYVSRDERRAFIRAIATCPWAGIL